MQSTQILATQQHCAYCFDVLISILEKKNKLPEFPANLPKCNVPVFVTLHINKNELRGCIGTFSPGPIDKQLASFTYSSAFEDDRFDPFQKKELANLDIGISLLINFQKGKKWNEWEVGKHGIIIEFTDDKGREYDATFLPEVAAEENWDIPTTLIYLIQKAGYKKKPDQIFDKIRLTTYESSKSRLTYQEYLEMKKQ